MGEEKITPAQLLKLAKQLKHMQGADQEAGALEQLAQTGISEEQQAKMREVMQDKAKLAQLMQSPQAQALMRKMNGGKQD